VNIDSGLGLFPSPLGPGIDIHIASESVFTSPRKVYFTGPGICPYPSNGRALTYDVLDVFLPILTNGKVTGIKSDLTMICWMSFRQSRMPRTSDNEASGLAGGITCPHTTP